MKKHLAFSLALLTIACSTVTAQLPSYLPADGLVGWWPFNGNANDESGNGNHGVVNGAVLAGDRFGSAMASINQQSDGSYIRTQSVLANISNSFTISFWANPSVVDTPKNQGVSGSEGYAYNSVIHPPHGSNWGSASINAGVGINVGQNQIQVVEHSHLYIASPLVYAGQIMGWHHIVLIYDNHIPKLYVDGLLVATGLVSSRQNVRPGNGYCSSYSQSGFGRSFAPNGNPVGNFKGDYDDIGIWNRALTNQEILVMYNGSNPDVMVEEIEMDIRLFPNPASTEVVVTINGEAPNEVQIFDASGRFVSSTQRMSRIDIQSLAAGIYTFRIVHEGEVREQQIVKQN